jgi:hypothetical protein
MMCPPKHPKFTTKQQPQTYILKWFVFVFVFVFDFRLQLHSEMRSLRVPWERAYGMDAGSRLVLSPGSFVLGLHLSP